MLTINWLMYGTCLGYRAPLPTYVGESSCSVPARAFRARAPRSALPTGRAGELYLQVSLLERGSGSHVGQRSLGARRPWEAGPRIWRLSWDRCIHWRGPHPFRRLSWDRCIRLGGGNGVPCSQSTFGTTLPGAGLSSRVAGCGRHSQPRAPPQAWPWPRSGDPTRTRKGKTLAIDTGRS